MSHFDIISSKYNDHDGISRRPNGSMGLQCDHNICYSRVRSAAFLLFFVVV